MEEFLSLHECAKILDVTPQAIWMTIRNKRMKPTMIDGRIYFQKEQLAEYQKNKYARRKTRMQDGEPVFTEKGRYSVPEVAKMFGVRTSRIYYMLRRGYLKHFRVGSTYVIEIDDKKIWEPIIGSQKG